MHSSERGVARESEVIVYGACPIKRRRSTKAEVGQLEQQILDVLTEDNPQSVRHVFYRMTDPRLPCPVEKSEAGYTRVQNRILLMRRAGTLPYGWIVDHTRRGYHTATYSSGAEYVANVARFYRGDLWAQAEYYCEVWAESRSIAGVLQGDCKELAVSLYPTGGFASVTLVYEAARQIEHHSEKPVVILYIGDYDPAGVLIDVAAEHELRTHLPSHIDLDFRRIAITPEQIEEYGLPGKPRKKSDRRALHIQETIEAEAMPAAILRKLLRDEIEALLPPHALEIAKIAEENERESLYFWAQRMEGEEG